MNTIIIEPQDSFKLSCGELIKGKNIKWDWETEKDLNNPPIEINFWIEDSEGNKNYEIEDYEDKGLFVVPSNDEWTLNWENPSYMEDSSSPAIKLKYKVEIVNQPPIASINSDKTSGSAPLTISFKGAGLDYDGTIVSYNWDFYGENTSDLQNPKYTFSNIGTYAVTLTVTDDSGDIGEDQCVVHRHIGCQVGVGGVGYLECPGLQLLAPFQCAAQRAGRKEFRIEFVVGIFLQK